MAYIGRPGQVEISATATTDTFTGNDGTTFTLSKSIRDNNPSFLEVFVSNVQQQPTVSYTIAGGTTLTFNEAPVAGEPIYVIFRDYAAAPNFTVPDAAITESKLASASVTVNKIGSAAVTNAKLATDAVTAAKIQNGAVTGDKLDVGAVTESKIVDASVTVNKIGSAAVTSAKLATDLVFNGVTGFNGGSLEKANVQVSPVPANITINNNESAIVYFTENTIANAEVTVNFTNLASVAVGNVASYAVLFQNNLEFNAYISAAQVDGTVANVLKWLGGEPTNGSANIDSYSFIVFKTATGTYTVLGAKNDFS